jgi:hypothetical protein
MQYPTANLRAVALDDHNIKMTSIIRMIFTAESPAIAVAKTSGSEEPIGRATIRD